MKKMTLGRVILHVFLIALSFTYILPLVLMVMISITAESAIEMNGYSFFPAQFSLEAYRQAFTNPEQIINSYKTTAIFSVVQVVLMLFIQTMMAYPLSRNVFNGKKFVTKFLFITMLFNGGLVPNYILNTQYLHLNDTIWIYILPSLVGAWNIFIFKSFFQGLPDGLVEAAKIDGAREFQVYFKMIIPLSTPVIATIGFMGLVGKWNDWNTALLYIRKPELYSLQYLLQKILREAEYLKNLRETNAAAAALLGGEEALPAESMRYAMAMLAAGPMLIVFPFFQKYFSKGMVVGSIKG